MKKIIKTFILVIILISLSGCFNYKEINDYAIVSGISIDIDEKDEDKYLVGIQIMNAKKDEETDNSLITFYKASGNTFYEALEKIMLDSPKELYLGHNEVIVISEELLKKKDPLKYLDYFMRDSSVEKDSLVMNSKDSKAYDVLKIITPLETIPSANLKSTLNIADNYSGTLTLITIDEFISDLLKKGKDPILPTVVIKGTVKEGESMENIKESDPDTKLKFTNLAYFKDNRLKGYLTNDESTGYNILANDSKETYINVLCDSKNYATIRVKKAKVKEKLYLDNKPVVNISAKVVADLLEYNCKADFINNPKYIKELQNNAEKKIIKLMKKTNNKLYTVEKSDILGYGFKFYAKEHNKMNKKNITQKDIINNISFSYKAKLEIESTELSIKSIRGEESE